MATLKDSSCVLNKDTISSLLVERNSPKDNGRALGFREHRRPMWTQHEKSVLRLLMRDYAGVTEFDPPDVHKHPIKNEMWRLLTSKYNDHPNVRTRDTKQLRKAWENLKYRARKMGSEFKSNSSVGRKSDSSGQGSTESSWPLDGISLGIDDQSYEDDNQEVLANDSKAATKDKEFPLYSALSDYSQEAVENGFPKFPFQKYSSTSTGISDSNKQRSYLVGNLFKNTISESSEFIKNYFENFSNFGERTIINLQPLISSIVGGTIPALLPFLPLSSPAFTSEIYFNYPFNRSGFAPADDCGSETSSPNDDSNFRPYSTQSPSSPDPWPSNVSNNAETTVPKAEDDKQPSFQVGGAQEFSVPSPNSIESCSSETPEFAILKLLSQKTSEENRHALSVQLLKMQLAHAEVEHEVKMKLLQTQLEYWQTKLRLQNEALKLKKEASANKID